MLAKEKKNKNQTENREKKKRAHKQTSKTRDTKIVPQDGPGACA